MTALFDESSLVCDRNSLIYCKSRLKISPLPYDNEMTCLTKGENYLAKLIVEYVKQVDCFKHVAI